MRDPYDILGVSKKASEAEIKKAFRGLAKKHHPDAHANNPAAAKRFQEISGAYDILGDKNKRAQFDRGEIDAAGNPKGFHPGAQGFRQRRGGGAGPDEFEFAFSRGAEGVKAEDIFSEIFGAFGGGGRRQAQARRGGDLALSTTISFTEAALGGSRRLDLPDGRQIEVKIPVGLKDGQQIRLRGQGAPGAQGGPAGDALVTISVAPHPYLAREGRDLRMDLPVTLKEAVLGAKVTVPTLGDPVSLSVPAHSNTGSVLRLRGKGIPATKAAPAGDLLVRLVVSLPDKPDAELDAFAKRWDAAYDPRAKLK